MRKILVEAQITDLDDDAWWTMKALGPSDSGREPEWVVVVETPDNPVHPLYGMAPIRLPLDEVLRFARMAEARRANLQRSMTMSETERRL